MSRDNKGILELIAVAVMFLLVTGVVLYNLEIESATADDQSTVNPVSAQVETQATDATKASSTLPMRSSESDPR